MQSDCLTFLGGTCNGSTWRDKLILQLNTRYYNPIVKDWNEEQQAIENGQKSISDIIVYVITPKIKGYYSIAEAVQDSCDNPWKVIFCVLEEDDGLTFDNEQLISLNAVKSLIGENGAYIAESLEEIAFCANAVAATIPVTPETKE